MSLCGSFLLLLLERLVCYVFAFAWVVQRRNSEHHGHSKAVHAQKTGVTAVQPEAAPEAYEAPRAGKERSTPFTPSPGAPFLSDLLSSALTCTHDAHSSCTSSVSESQAQVLFLCFCGLLHFGDSSYPHRITSKAVLKAVEAQDGPPTGEPVPPKSCSVAVGLSRFFPRKPT